MTVLRKALDDYYPDAHRIFVFGMMADKDVSLVSQILFRDTDTIYTVLAHTGDRAETPEKLAKRLHKNAIPMPGPGCCLPQGGQRSGSGGCGLCLRLFVPGRDLQRAGIG